MLQSSDWVRTAPLVIAHRGASAYTPENTLAAFQEAVKMEADAVELDAKLLKDGNIIVIHDATLDRTTNGEGSVYQYTYDEIRSLDAGSYFSTTFSTEIIPTLDIILKEIGEALLINIELTNYTRPWDRLPLQVIRLVKRLQLQKKVLLSSFNPWALVMAKRVDPEIPRALLVRPREPRMMRVLLKRFIDYVAYHPHHSLVKEEMMVETKMNQKKINVWTVNEKKRMEDLLHLGVDGLITDYPDIASGVIREFMEN